VEEDDLVLVGAAAEEDLRDLVAPLRGRVVTEDGDVFQIRPLALEPRSDPEPRLWIRFRDVAGIQMVHAIRGDDIPYASEGVQLTSRRRVELDRRVQQEVAVGEADHRHARPDLEAVEPLRPLRDPEVVVEAAQRRTIVLGHALQTHSDRPSATARWTWHRSEAIRNHGGSMRALMLELLAVAYVADAP